MKRCVVGDHFHQLCIDGRPERREKKYPFSNRNGYVWTGPQAARIQILLKLHTFLILIIGLPFTRNQSIRSPKPHCFETALQRRFKAPFTRIRIKKDMRFQKCADSCGRDCLRGIGIVIPFKIDTVEPPLTATPPRRPLFVFCFFGPADSPFISSYLNLSTMATSLQRLNGKWPLDNGQFFSSATEEKVRNGLKNWPVWLVDC